MPNSQPLALRVSVVILYTIIFVASLVGNTLVLFIISKKPYTRKTTSILFVNVALADLIIATLFIPDSVAYYFRTDKWPGGIGGDILCRSVRFLPVLAIVASIFTLAAMTLDRFIAVAYPARESKSCTPKTFTVIIWFSSTVLAFHRLLSYSNSNLYGHCEPNWSLLRIDNVTGWKISNSMYIVLLFCLPLVLMVVLYSIMCTKLSRQARPGISDTENVQRRHRRNRKVFKMLISIVVVFTLCWLPVAVIHLLWAFTMAPPPYVMFLCFWCGHSHSAINPWMYIYLNTQFRRAFLEIIGRTPPNVGRQCVRNENMKSSPTSKQHSRLRVVSRETVL